MSPVIIPTIVQLRWTEAVAEPSIARWRSLSQMLSSMVVTGSTHAPSSPMVDDLRTLAHVAYINALDMQPQREEEAA